MIEGFEGTLPSSNICELDGDRLLATIDGLSGRISEDSGRTWGPAFSYTQGGEPMAGSMFSTLVRLENSDLGGMYYRGEPVKNAGYATRTYYYASSADEGKTWSPGARVDIPGGYDAAKGIFSQYTWGNFIQLSTGRLLKAFYWQESGRHVGMPPIGPDPVTGIIQGKLRTRVADGHLYEAAVGGCYTYFSDDLGQTWTRCSGNVMVWPLPGEDNLGGFGATYEPVILELKDGRVVMFMRTNMGRLYQTFSDDGGDYWSQAEPTPLASGDVPCWPGRLRTTGDMMMIWNQSTTKEIVDGYSRGRLSVATSQDEGQSWGNFHTVALSEGMADVDRIDPPSVRHVRSKDDLGVLPDGYARHDYPRLAFANGEALLIYNSTRWANSERVSQVSVTIAPEKTLYS